MVSGSSSEDGPPGSAGDRPGNLVTHHPQEGLESNTLQATRLRDVSALKNGTVHGLDINTQPVTVTTVYYCNIAPFWTIHNVPVDGLYLPCQWRNDQIRCDRDIGILRIC